MDKSYFFENFRSFTEFPSAPFPKLKTLFLNPANWRTPEHSLNIDFSCFSESLEELRLESERLTDSSFISLASLKNLKALSLLRTRASYQILFPEVLNSLNQLR